MEQINTAGKQRNRKAVLKSQQKIKQKQTVQEYINNNHGNAGKYHHPKHRQRGRGNHDTAAPGKNRHAKNFPGISACLKAIYDKRSVGSQDETPVFT